MPSKRSCNGKSSDACCLNLWPFILAVGGVAGGGRYAPLQVGVILPPAGNAITNHLPKSISPVLCRTVEDPPLLKVGCVP